MRDNDYVALVPVYIAEINAYSAKKRKEDGPYKGHPPASMR